jgi:hypothetical protein
MVCSDCDNLQGTAKVYDSFLRFGQAKHVCKACDRPLTAAELKKVESYVSRHI